MLPEPWGTLLFLIGIPLLLQIFKVVRDKSGKAPSRGLIQGVSLVVSTLFVAISGGFAGLAWPAVPVLGGDVMASVTSLMTFLAEGSGVVMLAFGAITGLYELVFKRLFEARGYATKVALMALSLGR
jgi:hypothetical protein